MKVRKIFDYVVQIENHIKQIRLAMRHAHPHTVDALRATVTELEDILETLVNTPVTSIDSIESIFDKIRECVRECLHPSYTGKREMLPKPNPEEWTPPEVPVTVTGVNIIFVIDISDSMFEKGGLHVGGRMRNVLIGMANEIERHAKKADIPCKVSLVAYADPTNKSNQPTFWEIKLNKSTNVAGLSNAISTLNRKKWKRGYSWVEEGMTAIYRTMDAVADSSIVNGKPVENSLILVSDERQRLQGSENPAHPRYPHTVNMSQFRAKLSKHNINNTYALIPITRGYQNDGKSMTVGPVNWNQYVKNEFRDVKEFWGVTKSSDLLDWVKWTLDPDSYGS